jgi:hypothetical protein
LKLAEFFRSSCENHLRFWIAGSSDLSVLEKMSVGDRGIITNASLSVRVEEKIMSNEFVSNAVFPACFSFGVDVMCRLGYRGLEQCSRRRDTLVFGRFSPWTSVGVSRNIVVSLGTSPWRARPVSK